MRNVITNYGKAGGNCFERILLLILMWNKEKGVLYQLGKDLGKNDANYKYMERKYNNLCKMKEFQEGDILIVPKVPDNYHFALYRVKCKAGKAYIFDTSWDNGGLKGSNNKMTNDYRHVVFVEYIGDVSYRSAEESSIVSAGFTSRRSAINSIYSQKLLMLLRKSLKIWSIILSFILVKKIFRIL